MKRKALFILSLASALVCAFAVYTYTDQVRLEADQQRDEALSRYGGEQVEVCVATKDIAAGESISSDNVTTKQWLVDLLPEDAVSSVDELAGQQATSSIVAGEVISKRHFDGASLNIDVPEGLQAVSIEVEEAQAVGGALEAGSIVDVYAVGSSDTSLLASKVYVASAGNSSGTRTRVTLAVEPDLVEQLIAATQNSQLYLTLPSQRNERIESDDNDES